MQKNFYAATEFLFANGELGVNFFFVLSGFLITFLLIREQEVTGSIHLKNFYIRRLLRIWPLFYLCVFIGFVLIPVLKYFAGAANTEIANFWYYLFFINNFDYLNSYPQFPDALILIVLWSVAVEEQFYLAWPVILKSSVKKYFPIIFLLIIIGSLVFRSFYTGHDDHSYAVRQFHTLAVIGDMALGALMAWLCSFQSGFLKWITNMKSWQLFLLYAITFIFYFFRKPLLEEHFATQIFERLVFAILFGLIIVEQCFSKRSLFKMGNFKRLSSWGKYTYALYCLHFFTISIVVAVYKKSGLPFNIGGTIAISIAALIVVMLLSKLSYRYFESYFLKLKDRFAFIKKN